jgi:hypothetical protein
MLPPPRWTGAARPPAQHSQRSDEFGLRLRANTTYNRKRAGSQQAEDPLPLREIYYIDWALKEVPSAATHLRELLKFHYLALAKGTAAVRARPSLISALLWGNPLPCCPPPPPPPTLCIVLPPKAGYYPAESMERMPNVPPASASTGVWLEMMGDTSNAAVLDHVCALVPGPLQPPPPTPWARCQPLARRSWQAQPLRQLFLPPPKHQQCRVSGGL